MLIFACLCGCSNKGSRNVIPITKGFNCDFLISDLSLSGEMSVNVEGDISFIFTEPENIKSLSVRIKEESIILEVQGISERFKREEVPDDSPLLLVYDALQSMSVGELDITDFDSRTFVSSNNRNGSYKAMLDATGYITELSFSKCYTAIQFTNHTNIKNTES